MFLIKIKRFCMKKILFVLTITFCFSAFSQQKIEVFKSIKLLDDREYSVTLPASYEKDPLKKYPLIVLLDGEYMLQAFEGAISYGNYWDDLPEVIVVSIYQNPKFQREEYYRIDEFTGLPIEKGLQFFNFIGEEFIPFLDKKYRVAPYKIIAGHDFSANFANVFLYKQNPVFNAYISLSPEVDSHLIDGVSARLAVLKTPIFYYQATADGELSKYREGIQELDSITKTIKNPNLYYKFDDFDNASHYSMVLNAIPASLYHVFSAYQPISNNEYQDKILTLKENYVGYLTNKYSLAEKLFGIKLPFRMNDLRAVEAAILQNKSYDEFEKLAQICNKEYPKTMLYENYMGMLYESRGEIKRAIKSYRNAFIKEAIGDVTKNSIMNHAYDLKNQVIKLGVEKDIREVTELLEQMNKQVNEDLKP